MIELVKIMRLVNNLRDIHVPANSQKKKCFEKSYYVPNSFNRKNNDVLKNSFTRPRSTSLPSKSFL